MRPPTPADPLELACASCSGRGCDLCQGGVVCIDRCPYELLDSTTMRTVSLARMAKRGSWPVAGGTLEQTQFFMDYCQAVWADEARAQHGPDAEEMEE